MEIHILDIFMYFLILALIILYLENGNSNIPENLHTGIVIVYTAFYIITFAIAPDLNWSDIPEITFKL